MNRDRLILIAKLFGIVACLYFFIVGIHGMSEAFKLFGKDFAAKMLETTSSPFVGLFIGILATALVQSSSTTTSVIVGLVGTGAISIEGAIPMVMGANIGTTVTNLFVSLGHITKGQEFRRAFAAATVHDVFNWMTVLILFPLELATGVLAKTATVMAGWFQNAGGLKLGTPLKDSTKVVIEFYSNLCNDQPIAVLIISILIIISMLVLIVKLLRSLVLEKVEHLFSQHLFCNAGRAMFFGFALTVAVQSSSITTCLIVPLAGAGIVRLIQVLPYTLGANVGTTSTAMLAAMTFDVHAITVAFAHLLFNLLGIALIWPIKRIRMIPINIAEWLADLSIKNRFIPFALIAFIFFGLPIMFIYFFR